VAAPNLSPDAVEAFLVESHGIPVTDLEPLRAGFWSSAFAHRIESREFVVRFAGDRAGFEADRTAMAFDGPDLPAPAVLDIGDAFDGAYAISMRTFWGTFFPGIAAAEMCDRVLTAPWASQEPTALADAPHRHHCYELQIGATHLAWNAWVGDEAGLRWVAAHTAMLLERGPLAAGGTC
jgi:hypothetical protein